MLIRLAQSADLITINEIYNHAIALKATAELTPYSLQERHDWIKKHPPDKYPVFVAELTGLVAGWLSLSPYRAGRMGLRYTAEISYYIHPDFWRQGIGSALVRYAVRVASDYKFRVLIAIILEHNTASIQLLEKHHFEKWGFLPEVADFDGKRCGQFYYGKIIC